jgi:hypothetical protein
VVLNQDLQWVTTVLEVKGESWTKLQIMLLPPTNCWLVQTRANSDSLQWASLNLMMWDLYWIQSCNCDDSLNDWLSLESQGFNSRRRQDFEFRYHVQVSTALLCSQIMFNVGLFRLRKAAGAWVWSNADLSNVWSFASEYECRLK